MNLFSGCCPWLVECAQGPSRFSDSTSYAQLQSKTVRLDTTKMGKEVVILKEGERICGTGSALATTSIEQNKAYFQVNIQQTGVWAIGLANENCDLDSIPTSNFWGVRETGDVVANGVVVGNLAKPVDEGDSIGITYDHMEMRFYLNGEIIEQTATGVKGPAFPIIYVDDSAIIDVKFRDFSYPAPSGFDEIIVEQSLL